MKTEIMTAGGGAVTGSAYPSFGGKTMFEAKGTFDGASVAIQVSLDGSTWNPLHDSAGTAIAITAATSDVYAEIIPAEYGVRAVTTGGGGSASVTVTMVQ